MCFLLVKKLYKFVSANKVTHFIERREKSIECNVKKKKKETLKLNSISFFVLSE